MSVRRDLNKVAMSRNLSSPHVEPIPEEDLPHRPYGWPGVEKSMSESSRGSARREPSASERRLVDLTESTSAAKSTEQHLAATSDAQPSKDEIALAKKELEVDYLRKKLKLVSPGQQAPLATHPIFDLERFAIELDKQLFGIKTALRTLLTQVGDLHDIASMEAGPADTSDDVPADKAGMDVDDADESGAGSGDEEEEEEEEGEEDPLPPPKPRRRVTAPAAKRRKQK